MRILVTGSSGRVGSALADLLRAEHQVCGLDVVPGEQTTLLGDICDSGTVAHALAGVDAVIHTAALHAPHVATHSAQDFRRINVAANETLLQLCVTLKIKALIYTSTTSIYGHALIGAGRASWITEDIKPQARDIYDETKLAAEQQCAAAAGLGPLSVVVLRMSRCFPEAEHRVAWYRLFRGVDVRDVAAAHVLALRAALRTPGHHAIYNISARSPFQQSDCVELFNNAPAVVARYFPTIHDDFEQRGWTLPRSIDRVYVIEKARRELGYAPRYNFSEALAESDL